MNKSQSNTLKSSDDDDFTTYINEDGNEESEGYSSQNEEKEKADNSRQSLEQISEQDDESEVSMSKKSEDIKTIKEEEKKKILYKKNNNYKKGKAKEKKIITWKTPWLFDKNETRHTDENGNTICVWGDKDENCGVFIDKGKFYEGKGFRIINGKRNKNARHSITKMSKGGKNYTFTCK